MPVYEVQGPDGSTFEIDAPQPPSAQQLQSIFKAQAPSDPAPAPQLPSGGLTASIGERVRAKAGLSANPTRNQLTQALDKGEQERISGQADYLPSIGGAVGGMLAGPAGAVIGGAGGAAAKQSVKRGYGQDTPSTVGAQAKDIAKEGAVQGALEGVGMGIAAGAGKLSKWLMNRATSRVTQKLSSEFPELSDTLIDNALTVSQGGYNRAQAMLKGAKAKANAALKKAEEAGSSVPIQLTSDIADSLKTALIETSVKAGQTVQKAGDVVSLATDRLPGPVKKVFSEIESAIESGEAFFLSPKQADLLKTQLQKESRALYANRTAPNGPKAMEAEATLKAELASRLNDAIDAISKGYKEANKEAQPLIGAGRGLKQAIRPSGNLYQAMVRPAVGAAAGSVVGSREGGPGATAGAIAGAAMTSPRGMSMEAIALKHPAVMQLLKQLPRSAYATVIAALQQRQEPEQ